MREKKRSVGDKRFYYEETENISGRIPGPGAYNPHDRVVKLRKNKTIYGEWIKKHKSESEKKQKRSASIPAPGTYNPMNCTFTTFDTVNQSPKKKGDIDYFGKDARFTYVRPDKKKIKEERPSPNSYKTLFEWKGKGSPKKK